MDLYGPINDRHDLSQDATPGKRTRTQEDDNNASKKTKLQRLSRTKTFTLQKKPCQCIIPLRKMAETVHGDHAHLPNKYKMVPVETVRPYVPEQQPYNVQFIDRNATNSEEDAVAALDDQQQPQLSDTDSDVLIPARQLPPRHQVVLSDSSDDFMATPPEVRRRRLQRHRRAARTSTPDRSGGWLRTRNRLMESFLDLARNITQD